jgi:H+/gluconate symporter-like permease
MPGKRKSKMRRIVRIPKEYLEAIPLGNVLFPSLFQFENGLRIAINGFLTTCYGTNWWDISLKTKLPEVHKYAEDQETKRHSMPWIGTSARVPVLPIHLVTLGQLEEIVKKYQSDCIPDLFPTLDFFLGHMTVIKMVRNLFSHMFPCITSADCKTARREITTLAAHINAKL